MLEIAAGAGKPTLLADVQTNIGNPLARLAQAGAAIGQSAKPALPLFELFVEAELGDEPVLVFGVQLDVFVGRR